MIIRATGRTARYVPRFCYHEKPSIAANWRVPGGSGGRRSRHGLRHARNRWHEDHALARAPSARSAPRWNSCSSTIRSTVPSATRAASASFRISPSVSPRRRASTMPLRAGRDRPTDRHRHDALHPLHALRAVHRGDRGLPGARDDRPRRADESARRHREDRGPRALGQRHRSLPGRRVGVEAFPVPRGWRQAASARVAARRIP